MEPIPRRAVIRGFLLTGLLIACVGIFIWLMQALARGRLRAIDQVIIEWVAAYRTPTLTAIAVDFTALGSSTLLTVANLLIVALLWTSGRRLAAADTAVASSAAGFITRAMKAWLGHPRPPVAAHLVTVTGFAFPSGHASGIAALLTVTALNTIEAAPTRAQRIVLWIMHGLLILGVGWSRVYLNVHYPSDVVAGICVGIACALAAHGLVRTRRIARGIRQLLK